MQVFDTGGKKPVGISNELRLELGRTLADTARHSLIGYG